MQPDEAVRRLAGQMRRLTGGGIGREGGREVRSREAAVEGGAVDGQRRADQAGVVARLLAVALRRAVHPDHHVVIAAERRDMAGDIGVERQVARLRPEGPRIGEDALGVVRIAEVQPARRAAFGIAIDVEQFVVLAGRAAQGADLGDPAVAELVRDVAEDLAVDHVPPRPVRPGVRRTRQVDPRPVGIIERQRAPHRATAAMILMAVARADHGVRPHVRLDDTIAGPAAQVIAVEVAVAVLVHADAARADAAAGVERHADVGVQPHGVERAILRARAGLQRVIGALADEVDDGGRVAGRRQQSRRAAHDLDPIVDRGVHRSGLHLEREGQADAVDLERLDVETARRIIIAVGLLRLHGDAGDGGEQLVGIVQLEIGDLRAGDDADRLRRFAQADRQPRGGALLRDAVIVAALAALAGDDDLVTALRVRRRRRSGIGGGGRAGHRGNAEQRIQNGHTNSLNDSASTDVRVLLQVIIVCRRSGIGVSARRCHLRGAQEARGDRLT